MKIIDTLKTFENTKKRFENLNPRFFGKKKNV